MKINKLLQRTEMHVHAHWCYRSKDGWEGEALSRPLWDSEGKMGEAKKLFVPQSSSQGGKAVNAYHRLPASTPSLLFLTSPNTTSTALWNVLEGP